MELRVKAAESEQLDGGFDCQPGWHGPKTLLDGQRWEMENPDGNSEKAAKNQLKSAAGTHGREMQCDRVVTSNVSGRASLAFEGMCKQAKGLVDAGRFREIKGILIADEGGRMARLGAE